MTVEKKNLYLHTYFKKKIPISVFFSVQSILLY